MKNKKNHYVEIINILTRLNKSYPNLGFGHHIDIALGGEGDIWALDDKVICEALEKYESELGLDHSSDLNIEKIVEDGKKLSLEDEEEYFDDI